MPFLIYRLLGILPSKGNEDHFFLYERFVSAFDYYSPVIIANNDYLKSHKEEAKNSFKRRRLPICYRASRRSSRYLIKQAPLLTTSVILSLLRKNIFSSQYASEVTWGSLTQRWNAFYAWARVWITK